LQLRDIVLKIIVSGSLQRYTKRSRINLNDSLYGVKFNVQHIMTYVLSIHNIHYLK